MTAKEDSVGWNVSCRLPSISIQQLLQQQQRCSEKLLDCRQTAHYTAVSAASHDCWLNNTFSCVHFMNIIIIFYVHTHNFNLQLPTLLVSYEKFCALKRDMNSRNIVKYQPTIGSKLCFNVVTFSQQIYLVESTNPLELSYCSHVNMYIYVCIQ